MSKFKKVYKNSWGKFEALRQHLNDWHSERVKYGKVKE